MRKNNITRIFSAILALLMLTSLAVVFASCDSGDDKGTNESTAETDKTSNSGTGESGNENTPEVNAYDSLEHTQYNRQLKLVTTIDESLDFTPNEEKKGETLTDMLITRNIRIKNDYGVEIVSAEIGNYKDLIQTMTQQQSGRLDDYDLYLGQLHNFVNNALQNHCVDFNIMSGIDLKGDWWDSDCSDTLVIDGKNFMVTGDISTTSMLISSCMVFNKNMMQDLKKSEPYTLVKDDKWTLDTLYEYVADVTNPDALDGRGRYGLTCWVLDVPYSMFYGCNEKFVRFDETTGTPEISYNSEKVISIYEKIYKIILGAKSFYLKEADPDTLDAEAYNTFADGRALFCDITLFKISKYIRNMEDDYGVVPMPKYDEAQDEYLTFVNGAVPLFFVSTTEKEPEFVCTMMEAMARYNYSYVTQNLYEVIVKSKDARDPQTPEMVDIILRSHVYDFAYFADLSLSYVVSTNLSAGRETVAAQYKTATKSSGNSLKKLLGSWKNIQSKQ